MAILPSDSYLPISFVEALGRATVARHQVELSIDILLAIMAIEPTRFGTSESREPFETKIAYLINVRRSRLLKHEWWRRAKEIALRAEEQNRQYANGARASIYGRGSGFLENVLRLLSERTGVAPEAPGMTPAKLDDVAAEFRLIARDTCDLAACLLEAAAKLSILPAGHSSS